MLDVYTLQGPPVNLPTHPLIPDPVRDFLYDLYRYTFLSPNPALVQSLYTEEFHRINDSFYAKSAWPEADTLCKLLGVQDELFVLLYKEVYYRQIFAHRQPTIDERTASYENYVEVFNHLLGDSPSSLELPLQWLWDIVDEFIYQFQTWCHYRSTNLLERSTEELLQLAEFTVEKDIWDIHAILNVLYSLIEKSCVRPLLDSAKQKGVPESTILDDPGSLLPEHEDDGERQQFPKDPGNLYKMLGYYAIIGLLRVHSLLGDYTQALNVVGSIQLHSNTALITRVLGCHVTCYYFVGFAFMKSKRYRDAVWSFHRVLSSITRTRFADHVKGYQLDTIMKRKEQMNALMTICMAVCPNQLEDQYLGRELADQLGKIQSVWVGSFGGTKEARSNENDSDNDEDNEAEGAEAQTTRTQRVLGDEALRIIMQLYVPACPKFIELQAPDFEQIFALGNQRVELVRELEEVQDAAMAAEIDPATGEKLPLSEDTEFLLNELESKLAHVEGAYESLLQPPQPSRHQLTVFLEAIHDSLVVPALRNALKLYSSISLKKLSHILEVPEELIQTLVMRFNARARGLKWVDKEKTRPIDGEVAYLTDIRIWLDKGIVHVEELKGSRKNTEYYLNSIEKLAATERRMSSKLAGKIGAAGALPGAATHAA